MLNIWYRKYNIGAWIERVGEDEVSDECRNLVENFV